MDPDSPFDSGLRTSRGFRVDTDCEPPPLPTRALLPIPSSPPSRRDLRDRGDSSPRRTTLGVCARVPSRRGVHVCSWVLWRRELPKSVRLRVEYVDTTTDPQVESVLRLSEVEEPFHETQECLPDAVDPVAQVVVQ